MRTVLPLQATQSRRGRHTSLPGKVEVSRWKLFLCVLKTDSISFCSVTDTYRVIRVTIDTSVAEVMVQALDEFGLASSDLNRYRLVEVSLEKGCK